MSRIPQRGTVPEQRVRRICRALGLRYTTANRDLPGSPDLANRSRRWAIFVHGCYWHRHCGCSLSTTPKTNVSFWLTKFAQNIERDRKAAALLRRSGYLVVTVWQCETKDAEMLSRTLSNLQGRVAVRTKSVASNSLHGLSGPVYASRPAASKSATMQRESRRRIKFRGPSRIVVRPQ